MRPVVRHLVQLALAQVRGIGERALRQGEGVLRAAFLQRLFRQGVQGGFVFVRDLALAALPNVEGIARQQVQRLSCCPSAFRRDT